MRTCRKNSKTLQSRCPRPCCKLQHSFKLRVQSCADTSQVGNLCQRSHGNLHDHHILVSVEGDIGHNVAKTSFCSCYKDQSTNGHSFCITNLEEYLEGGDFPIIQIVYDATGSYAATCVLGGLLVILLFFSTVTTVASASRQVWAFSRDRGFPFSAWICHVRPGWDIPANAVSSEHQSGHFGPRLISRHSWSFASQSLSSCPLSTSAQTRPSMPFSRSRTRP